MNERPKRILVLDDEEAIRLSLEMFLGDFSWQVHTAADTATALKLIEHNCIDLALVDVRLAGESGNRFIVEALKIQPKLKVLIHTGSIDYAVPPELQKLGIGEAQVVRKPQPDLMRFLALLEAQLAGS
ncbi:response regulator receiver domain-containing protein [Geothermobacter ehrlichii]|uniref:Response regulator receiver domain-containing protein n=1 Tax=Geothermobacter ehrlichii TaxID=213224 RepID=A0A5D3WFL2_9BACT|nr:response regulator [Geothermobacter ehrlichii]TYO96649.1 response regulator receiver domain-containing protein [Geothermobacter ehrlichii]